MCVRERHELVHLQEIVETLTVQRRDNADMVSEVEAMPEVNAPVAVIWVVRF